MWASRSRGFDFLIFLVIFALPGCTATSVVPRCVERSMVQHRVASNAEFSGPVCECGEPLSRYDLVYVGNITSDQADWQNQAKRLKEALVTALGNSGQIESVHPTSDSSKEGEQSSEPYIVVTGRLTKADEGNSLKKALLGFGSGRSRVSAYFEVRDSRGENALMCFHASKEYTGGIGGPGGLPAFGFINFYNTVDLIRGLGHESGISIVGWMRGDEIAKSFDSLSLPQGPHPEGFDEGDN